VSVVFNPIGVIRTPHARLEGMPIQPAGARGVRGTIEIRDDLVPGLKDLDGFSHLILIYHLHRATGANLRVVPFMDTEKRGVFATRAPRRPNPIGLSVVRLVGIEGNVLTIEDVDMLDGTPLLDIKPYVDEFDGHAPSDLRTGWLERVRTRVKRERSDDRFR